MARWYLAFFLQVFTAGAVRTTTTLKACPYTSLQEAQAKEVQGGVRIQFCGEDVTLTTSETKEETWRPVCWWDSKLQGEQLTEYDLNVLDKYLGQYGRSRPIGQLGHGLLPKNFEDFAGDRWDPKSSKSLAATVLEALKFEVDLAEALNKIRPASTSELYRGGWTAAAHLEQMQHSLDSGSVVAFPWFQSTTTDGSHAFKFMGKKTEPETCANECIEKGEAFPSYLTYKTCRGKNVTKWNVHESEWLLLPNLKFQTTNITKIWNDPWQLWSPEEMAAWLDEEHTVIKDWSVEGNTTFGPWPDIAAVVRENKIDGPAFLDWFQKKEFPEPFVAGPWDTSEYLYSDERQELRKASWGRFKLPLVYSRMGAGPNSIQFYYEITLQDTQPCSSASSVEEPAPTRAAKRQRGPEKGEKPTKRVTRSQAKREA
mmetsp:Transcript_50434/g.113342  ORF Transcript_50434/g.113342 Transcript_50434/m.113342 type:complete len:427 (+) Transcript_50434:61-1341(+)